MPNIGNADELIKHVTLEGLGWRAKNATTEEEASMPQTEVLLYREDDNSVPLIDWLDSLQQKARDRCLDRLVLLHEQGHELRRPHAENLGNGLYELRVKFYHVNYRMLYFFHGGAAAVVSHGLAKEQAIPAREIELALKRKKKFKRDPLIHTFSTEG